MLSNKKVIISSHDFIHVIEQNNIVFCRSENCYTYLYLADGESILVSKSLAKFSQELSSFLFIRVNQSYLININFIKSISKRNKCIELLNLEKIAFTIKIKELLKLLNNHMPY